MRRPMDSGAPCWAAMSLTIVLAFSVRVSTLLSPSSIAGRNSPPFLATTAYANPRRVGCVRRGRGSWPATLRVDEGGHAVRSLWRDRRVRGTVVLIALLGLYFAVPVEHQSSTVRLVTSLVVALICLVIAGSVFYREFRRMLRGEELSLTGLQLLMVLEAVLLMFALGYYSLAIHQP